MAAHPDHRQGLEIAARASRAAVGQEQRAAAYECLLVALAGTGAPAGPAPAGTPQAPEPLPAGEVLPGEAEIDAFLEEVLGSDPDVDRPRITLALARACRRAASCSPRRRSPTDVSTRPGLPQSRPGRSRPTAPAAT